MDSQKKSSTVCIIMGVSGSGKSTIGHLLSQELGWQFYDGDDFHPLENVEKMKQGISLNDADREPWLKALRHLIDNLHEQEQNGIIACSALKEQYRDLLQGNDPNVILIYLQGRFETIRTRLLHREGHFMKVEMLTSQWQTLEAPKNAIVVDISLTPPEIVEKIIAQLSVKQLI
ncbi:carbohydrate kinase, thermoresistant glucokinase family [Gloeothece citriformis PCC 7424]|uniref:Gluconokinase n=1 Tax=Gloeothece citriformis (strain PCC 7424) TaxID=65393 RepID=B7KEC8_GLOC7|nr:gluconokinase [Gloeothece citriformis]ACK73246.1 carbohydrate kinase, thermoresistant glucokinase family [Gloeothece citriformis PCC 7424]